MGMKMFANAKWTQCTSVHFIYVYHHLTYYTLVYEYTKCDGNLKITLTMV